MSEENDPLPSLVELANRIRRLERLTVILILLSALNLFFDVVNLLGL